MAAAEENHETSAIELWLEIDRDREPISGSIRAGDEVPRRFVGWLGFTALLESIRRHDDGTVAGRPKRWSQDGNRGLTAAERAIVELVCDGLTNPQIAERFTISPRTVQGHLLKVFRKLDVSTRAELVSRVLRMGNRENAPFDSQGSECSSQTSTAIDTNQTVNHVSTKEEKR